MPDDAPSRAQQRRIAERCWQVYEWVCRRFAVAPEVHEQFPETAELALWTGARQVRVLLADPPGYALGLWEAYVLSAEAPDISRYSYVLLERETPILRADPSPHHDVDYRGRKLTRFPHHLHDEQGRVRSFSGHIEDFLSKAAALLRNQS